LKSVALPVCEIIAIEVLYGDWGCKPLILGKRRPQRVGVVPFERALLSSYRAYILTFIYLYTFERYCRF